MGQEDRATVALRGAEAHLKVPLPAGRGGSTLAHVHPGTMRVTRACALSSASLHRKSLETKPIARVSDTVPFDDPCGPKKGSRRLASRGSSRHEALAGNSPGCGGTRRSRRCRPFYRAAAPLSRRRRSIALLEAVAEDENSLLAPARRQGLCVVWRAVGRTVVRETLRSGLGRRCAAKALSREASASVERGTGSQQTCCEQNTACTTGHVHCSRPSAAAAFVARGRSSFLGCFSSFASSFSMTASALSALPPLRFFCLNDSVVFGFLIDACSTLRDRACRRSEEAPRTKSAHLFFLSASAIFAFISSLRFSLLCVGCAGLSLNGRTFVSKLGFPIAEKEGSPPRRRAVDRRADRTKGGFLLPRGEPCPSDRNRRRREKPPQLAAREPHTS